MSSIFKLTWWLNSNKGALKNKLSVSPFFSKKLPGRAGISMVMIRIGVNQQIYYSS